MKATILAVSLLTALASATSISYDTGYDNSTRSLDLVSCSDGTNGLTTKYGWKTQSDIPNSPHIAGWNQIGGWNSPSCGTCLAVTYAGKTINVLAIDHTDTGLNMAQDTMDELTNGQAVMLGRVEADVKPVDVGQCGVKAGSRRSAEFMA